MRRVRVLCLKEHTILHCLGVLCRLDGTSQTSYCREHQNTFAEIRYLSKNAAYETKRVQAPGRTLVWAARILWAMIGPVLVHTFSKNNQLFLARDANGAVEIGGSDNGTNDWTVAVIWVGLPYDGPCVICHTLSLTLKVLCFDQG